MVTPLAASNQKPRRGRRGSKRVRPGARATSPASELLKYVGLVFSHNLIEAEKLGHIAPILFRGTAPFASEHMFDPGLFGAFVLGGRCQVGHEFRQLLGADAGPRQAHDFQGTRDDADANGHGFANVNIAPRLGFVIADRYFARATSSGRVGTRFENAHAPKPFVEAGIVHGGIQVHDDGKTRSGVRACIQTL